MGKLEIGFNGDFTANIFMKAIIIGQRDNAISVGTNIGFNFILITSLARYKIIIHNISMI